MHKIISAHDLKIDLENANEEGLFKWLVASFLMGKRIQAQIAAEAYRVIVEKHQRDTPRKLAHSTHRELVAMLGEAGRAVLASGKADGDQSVPPIQGKHGRSDRPRCAFSRLA